MSLKDWPLTARAFAPEFFFAGFRLRGQWFLLSVKHKWQ
jgi:hypothetical protein